MRDEAKAIGKLFGLMGLLYLLEDISLVRELCQTMPCRSSWMYASSKYGRHFKGLPVNAMQPTRPKRDFFSLYSCCLRHSAMSISGHSKRSSL